MNVLFLMINFQDIKKDPYLYTDLAEEFYLKGNNVYVATILEKKNGRKTVLSKEYGINVLRIRTGDIFNVGLIRKGITTVSIPIIFKTAVNKYFKKLKFDLIIYPTPPITLAPVVKYLKKKYKCRSYLILRDIFPQNGVDLGVINNKIIYYFFRYKEIQLYKVSDYIGCMSQGNINYVINNNEIDKQKLELLYNWTKVKRENNMETVNYREKYALDNKIIAIHGGNLGIAQELTFLLQLADKFKYRDDIVFLIIGKGTEKDKIQKILINKHLKNVIMEDYIPNLEFENVVKQCDIGLVNLYRNFTIPNFPSKTLTYFKAKIPILASIDSITDYGEFLDKTESGLWSITGDIDAYIKNLNILVDDKNLRIKMGENGYKFLIENLDVEKSYAAIINHFK